MPHVEFDQLPAPLVEVVGNNTRGVLFAPCSLMRVDKRERVRATHIHACFGYAKRQHLISVSMGHRFGIKAQNGARASRLIAESVREGVIAPHDPDMAPRLMRYVPWWARAGTSRDTRRELPRCAPRTVARSIENAFFGFDRSDLLDRYLIAQRTQIDACDRNARALPHRAPTPSTRSSWVLRHPTNTFVDGTRFGGSVLLLQTTEMASGLRLGSLPVT